MNIKYDIEQGNTLFKISNTNKSTDMIIAAKNLDIEIRHLYNFNQLDNCLKTDREIIVLVTKANRLCHAEVYGGERILVCDKNDDFFAGKKIVEQTGSRHLWG